MTILNYFMSKWLYKLALRIVLKWIATFWERMLMIWNDVHETVQSQLTPIDDKPFLVALASLQNDISLFFIVAYVIWIRKSCYQNNVLGFKIVRMQKRYS